MIPEIAATPSFPHPLIYADAYVTPAIGQHCRAAPTHICHPPSIAAQCLSQDHTEEEKGYLGILLSVEHTSPLCSQDCSKPVPHLPWGRGVTDS